MKIVILVAMDKELSLLLRLMKSLKELRINDSAYYSGEINGHEILVGKCGIGKVNAALNAYKIINKFEPDLVINSGVAGGVDGSLGVGTVLVADRVAYHDVWCGPGTEYGAADGFGKFFECDPKVMEVAGKLFSANPDVKTGLICSGDRFIHLAQEVKAIKESFPDAKAVDMESAAISQTCSMNGVPFAVIRVMSDTPGHGENISQYKNFWNDAPEKTFHCIERILESL